MKNEIWKDIPGYEGLYQVSDLGNVKSLDRIVKHKKSGHVSLKGKLRTFSINQSGYYFTSLCKKGNERRFTVHQLVAMAFLNHKPNGMRDVVNHKNFIRTDNRLENLEIVSMRVNGNKKHLDSSSKYTGVTWEKDRNKWASRITYKGKGIKLGSFNSEKEASVYYENALKAIETGNKIITATKKPTSKHKGVSWISSQKKWRAEIYLNKKTKYIGSYNSEEDAVRAVKKAKANLTSNSTPETHSRESNTITSHRANSG